jgi:hypothetical protein
MTQIQLLHRLRPAPIMYVNFFLHISRIRMDIDNSRGFYLGHRQNRKASTLVCLTGRTELSNCNF